MFIRHTLLLICLVGPIAAQAQSAAGKTLVARGAVKAISDANSDPRKLKRRSPIFANDIVSTGANAKAQLRMTDGGMIALKENSELMIADYRFSDDNGRGSVVMELVKGGLRSVTGSIKAESGDYKLKTPVGSIGIRGTHYEVEIVGGTIWVAVWDGAVDLDITSGSQAGSTLSLGQTEGYSYASVDPNGTVTTYIEPPETFDSGMTSEADDIDQNENDEDEETESEEQSTGTTVATNNVVVAITPDNNVEPESDVENDANDDANDELEQESAITVADDTDLSGDIGDTENLDNEEFNAAPTLTFEEQFSNRDGQFTYSRVAGEELTSTAGLVTNFQLSMTIDFDKGTVPEGNMSFEDPGGEWFATFDGIISVTDIDLDITYASHGDNLADGDIDAFFLPSSLESIHGNFTLEEIANPDIRVTGKFEIK